MRVIRCFYQNGTIITTQINGTNEAINKYFLGKLINIGDGEKDNMQKCTNVEFLDLDWVKP